MMKTLIDWYCHEPILWDELGDRINTRLFNEIKDNGRLSKDFIDKYLECEGFHDWTIHRITIEEGQRRNICFDLYKEYPDNSRDQVRIVFYNFFNITVQEAFSKHTRKHKRTEILAILFQDVFTNIEVGICFSDNSTMHFSIPENNVKITLYNVTTASNA